MSFFSALIDLAVWGGAVFAFVYAVVILRGD